MHTITFFFFFFFNDTATTEIYTLSLHDALPISLPADGPLRPAVADDRVRQNGVRGGDERVAPLLIGDRLGTGAFDVDRDAPELLPIRGRRDGAGYLLPRAGALLCPRRATHAARDARREY